MEGAVQAYVSALQYNPVSSTPDPDLPLVADIVAFILYYIVVSYKVSYKPY